MIQAEGLRRSYGETVAVDAVSFEIASGEIVGLLGHNGAGKTTIMKMLTGYLEPDEGRIEIDGVDIQDDPDRVQEGLGYLPESLPIYPEMIVADYLDYVASLRGVAEAERANALARTLEATDLIDRALDPIATLSRGFQQRVGVAQAIVHQPRFLILDEPTNGLDPSQTQQMRELILRLAEEATVILSTHIMQEVDAVCSRVMMLRSGRLALDQSLADLKRSDRLILHTSSPEQVVVDAVSSIGTVAVEGSTLCLAQLDDGEPIDSFAARVAERLVTSGVVLNALYPEKRDLETVFRDVSEAADAI